MTWQRTAQWSLRHSRQSLGPDLRGELWESFRERRGLAKPWKMKEVNRLGACGEEEQKETQKQDPEEVRNLPVMEILGMWVTCGWH